MTIAGVPWAEIREAGRLDRLYREISWTHRKETGALPAFDRWFGVVPPLLRWSAVAILVWQALAPEGAPLANSAALSIVALLFSLPLLRLNFCGRYDVFQALRAPSREALLLARWLDIAPALLAAGVVWAVFLWAQTVRVPGVRGPALAVLLLAVAAFPFRLAAGGTWRKVADRSRDDRQSAFLRCVLFAPFWGAIAWNAVAAGGRFAALIALAGLLCLGSVALLAFHLRSFVREGTGHASDWGLAMLRVLVVELGSLALVAALVFVCVGLGSRFAGPETFVPWAWPIAVLGVIASPAAAVAIAAVSLRDARTAEVPAARRESPEETPDQEESRDSARMAIVGRAAAPSTARSQRIGPGRRFRTGAWAAHVGLWLSGLKASGVVIRLLLLAAAFVAIASGMRGGAESAWMLAIVGLFAWRVVGVDHPDRLYLLGMDLRERVRHDLRALLVFGVLPLTLFVVVAILVYGWTPGAERGLALLAAVLLFRAGQAGIRNIAVLNRIPFAGPWGIAFVSVLMLLAAGAQPLFGLPDALGVGIWGGLGCLGAGGLVVLLTRSEDDLREEMRRTAA